MEYLFVIILVTVIFCVYFYLKEEKKRNKKLQRSKERGDWKDIYTRQYEAEYGCCSKCFFGERFTILAFDETKTLLVNTNPITYDKIAFCKVKECEYTSKEILHTFQEIPVYETKMNTANTAKRAIAGGIIAGPVGAVIGGATAKRETITKSKEVLKEKEFVFNETGYVLSIFSGENHNPDFELITSNNQLAYEIISFMRNKGITIVEENKCF